MKSSKLYKSILFSIVYGLNLLLALALWLCGLSGNIMIGIFLIALYRLSLWTAPIAITIICWLPSEPKLPVRKKLLFNLVQLLLCGALFCVCFLVFGNWY